MTCTVQRLLSLPSPRTTTLEAARDFAGRNYAGQRRGNPERYEAHLQRVEEVARRFGIPNDLGLTAEEFLTAVWLHDVVEGTGIPLSRVEEAFGSAVAGVVGALSDRSGATRSQRQAATYPHIRALPAALRLKLMDRIANIEVALESSEIEMLACYRREAGTFKKGLYLPGSNQVLWAHLEDLYGAIDQCLPLKD